MPNLVELIKRASIDAVSESKPTSIVFGKVISISPLKINVEQKLNLTKAQLILSRNVTDYKTKLSFDNPDLKQEFTTWNMPESTESSPSKIAFKKQLQHDITIYNALKIGEEVILLQVQGGQKYIVLDRVVV